MSKAILNLLIVLSCAGCLLEQESEPVPESEEAYESPPGEGGGPSGPPPSLDPSPNPPPCNGEYVRIPPFDIGQEIVSPQYLYIPVECVLDFNSLDPWEV